MKNIELIYPGKTKDAALHAVEKKYLQNINYYVKFTVTVVKEGKGKDDRQVLDQEGRMIAAMLQSGDFVIALDRQGDKMDSAAFAAFLADKLSYFPGRIVFLIGGFAGLSPKLEKFIRQRISFSAMTMAHDLFRVVFLEQLYRALTIIQHLPYHR